MPNTNTTSQELAQFCSGTGSHHTNEFDASNPGRKLTKYKLLDLSDIRIAVDDPAQTSKPASCWFLASAHPSRNFQEQRENGLYWALVVDLDTTPCPLAEVASTVAAIVPGSDYEVYASRSATAERQKGRVIIPLARPLTHAEWLASQKALNDLLELYGITPDRALERAAQLIYLPNRGEFYESHSRRRNRFFDAKTAWASAIDAHQQLIDAEEEARLAIKAAAAARLENTASGSISEYNANTDITDLLACAGYDTEDQINWRHPASETGSFSLQVTDDNRAYGLSTTDPLGAVRNSGKSVSAFDAYAILHHGGDEHEASKELFGRDVFVESGPARDDEFEDLDPLWCVEDNEDAGGTDDDGFEFDSDFEGPAPTKPKDKTKEKAAPRLVRAADLLKLPDAKWRIKGVLPETGTAMIVGPPGSGKSFLGLDMARAIASGSDWCGKKTKQAPVVYCILEGRGGAKARAQAALAEGQEDEVLYWMNELDLGTEEGRKGILRAMIAEKAYRGVIFIDTMNQASLGQDENSPDGMGKILAGAKEIQRVMGGLVVLIHHPGKDASKGARGHSSLFGAVDAELTVTGDAEASDGLRTVKVSKQKDGVAGMSWVFKLRPVVVGEDEDGDEITSCVVDWLTARERTEVSPGFKGSVQPLVFAAVTEVLASASQNDEFDNLDDLDEEGNPRPNDPPRVSEKDMLDAVWQYVTDNAKPSKGRTRQDVKRILESMHKDEEGTGYFRFADGYYRPEYFTELVPVGTPEQMECDSKDREYR